jgi:hypothetical protein
MAQIPKVFIQVELDPIVKVVCHTKKCVNNIMYIFPGGDAMCNLKHITIRDGECGSKVTMVEDKK